MTAYEQQVDTLARKLRRFVFRFTREKGLPPPVEKFDLKHFRSEAENIIRSFEAS